MTALVRVEVHGGVGTVVLDRPERRNALSWQVVGELRAGLAHLRHDPEARVVVLTGAGDRAFCAGADLEEMVGPDQAAAHRGRGELGALFDDLWRLGKPTIARVQGAALAGGFGLALACDLVLAVEGATFGAPEVDVGLWPMMITVPMLRSMPPKVALELMMTGRRVTAAEGRQLGFVRSVHATVADLDAAVAELAAVLATKPPAVLRLGRDAFYAVVDEGAAAAMAALHPLSGVVAGLPDATEGVAAFKDKRRPHWGEDR